MTHEKSRNKLLKEDYVKYSYSIGHGDLKKLMYAIYNTLDSTNS